MAEMTESEAQELLRQYSEGKVSPTSFFRDVVKTDDTLRVGNLDTNELGISKLPVRTYEELALFSKEVANQPEWGSYFDKMSEIQTSSSLSKEGFLLKQINTTKKELADVTAKPKENKGWFRGKKEESPNPTG
jgi:hypothetical protein